MKNVFSLLLVAALLSVSLAKDASAPAAGDHPVNRHHDRATATHHTKTRGGMAAHKALLRQRQEDALLEGENLMPVMPRALPATASRMRKLMGAHKPTTRATTTKDFKKEQALKFHKRGVKKFNVKKHAWKKNTHKDKTLKKQLKKEHTNKEFVRDGHSLKDMLAGPRTKKWLNREKRAKLRSHKKMH